MKQVIKQFVSFILPLTVLILVPIWIEPNLSVNFVLPLIAGLLLMGIGLFILTKTISAFIRIGKGTLAPWNPTKKLVTAGMYGYVRNPMIIMGVLTVITGESLAIMSLNLFYWAVIFFLLNNVYFLIYEEPNLEKRFGEEYRNYKKKNL
ncbi:MAG: methyltransferase [Bacteroidota bacterium]|nr:methyltransferase [Bacteroidota bacterium]